jgi:cytochrome c553
MRKYIWFSLLALFVVTVTGAQSQQPAQEKDQPNRVPPQWAYGFKTPLGSPASEEPASTPTDKVMQDWDHGQEIRLPGSSVSSTLAQMRKQGPVDWYPEDHPQMPEIVAHGRKGVQACQACHYSTGKGDPANASIQDLPYSYFVQTMEDFRAGLRKSADPRKNNTNSMIAYAKAMTEDEIKEVAKYYGSIRFASRVKVIESKTVPKTRLVAAGLYFPLEGNETEPLGDRLIETPETGQAFVYKNPRAKAFAYVPPGSINRGERLVMNGGNGKTVQCSVCHGADLLGLGPVPGIAGRLPSYMVRQFFDMQNGFRTDEWTDLMKPVVAKLTTGDMIDIAAYLASRKIGAAE